MSLALWHKYMKVTKFKSKDIEKLREHNEWLKMDLAKAKEAEAEVRNFLSPTKMLARTMHALQNEITLTAKINELSTTFEYWTKSSANSKHGFRIKDLFKTEEAWG